MRTIARATGTVALAIALAVVSWMGPSQTPLAPQAAEAASCRKPHTLTLDRGAVSPGSGTVATSFRFTVRYRDSAGCGPTQVSVTVVGLGVYPMTGSGTTYTTGVTFSTTRRLPAGTWTYFFTASSGTAGGATSATLRAVSPARAVVRAAPAPTPRPTPKPTPRPAKSTPKPATSGAQTPAASAVAPGPVAGAPGSSGGTGGPGGDATPSTSAGGAGPVDDGTPRAGGGAAFQLPAVFRGPGSGAVGIWLIATLAGMFLFWLIMRRSRGERSLDRAAEGTQGARGRAAGLATADVSPEEAQMPRWRRPSLQQARQGSRYGPPVSRPALEFTTQPPPGTERLAVHYRFVRVADAPDDVRSIELGRLDRGDEVDVLDRRTGFALVRAPDGLEGWVPRMTLGEREVEPG